jgi:hypothetical protein
MSTPQASQLTAAPWRAEFLSHLKHLGLPTCVLSTVHAAPNDHGGDGSISWVPRARTVVFRGMWGSLPDNPDNPAQRNPPVFESDLLALTTDARMEKAGEIVGFGDWERVRDGGQSGTGTGTGTDTAGGAPFETVFWISGAMTQWRFSGRAYLLGQDVESDAPAVAQVRETLARRMRRIGEGEFGWEREITAHFGNMSPLMRGTFRNPPPGRPVDSGSGGEGLGLGQRVEDLQDEGARRHFRVVVLLPEEVDKVDLGDPERARRWRYRYVESAEGGGVWETTEVWP